MTTRPANFIEGRAEYLDDMRDGHKLTIVLDDQGDVYVSVIPEGDRFGPCVRLCASGGAAECAPGLLQAMRHAHDAIKAAAEGRERLAAIPEPAPVDAAQGERLRPEVRVFAEAMERKLQENDHKPGWKRDDPMALLDRLDEEAGELRAVVLAFVTRRAERPDDPQHARVIAARVAREAADVGNFAMMVADVCGGLAIQGGHPRAEERPRPAPQSKAKP